MSATARSSAAAAAASRTLQSSSTTSLRPPGHIQQPRGLTAGPTDSAFQIRARLNLPARVAPDPPSGAHANATQGARGNLARQQLGLQQDASTRSRAVDQSWRTQPQPQSWAITTPKPAAWTLKVHHSPSPHADLGPYTSSGGETRSIPEAGQGFMRPASRANGLSRQADSTNVRSPQRLSGGPHASSETWAGRPRDPGSAVVQSSASGLSIQQTGSAARDPRSEAHPSRPPAAGAVGPSTDAYGRGFAQIASGASTVPGAPGPLLDYCEALALGALAMIEHELRLLPQGTAADKPVPGAITPSRARRQVAEQGRLAMVFKAELLLAVYAAIYAEPPTESLNSWAWKVRPTDSDHSVKAKAAGAPTWSQLPCPDSGTSVAESHGPAPTSPSATSPLPGGESESAPVGDGLTFDPARSRATELRGESETTERVVADSAAFVSDPERDQGGSDETGVSSSAKSATSAETAGHSVHPPAHNRKHRASVSLLGFLDLPQGLPTWTSGTPMAAAEVNRALPWVRRCVQRLGHAVEFGRLILPSGVGDVEGGPPRTPRVGVRLSPTVWWAFFNSLQHLGPLRDLRPNIVFFMRCLLPSFPYIFEPAPFFPPPSVYVASAPLTSSVGAEASSAFRPREDDSLLGRSPSGNAQALRSPVFWQLTPIQRHSLFHGFCRMELPYVALFVIQMNLCFTPASFISSSSDWAGVAFELRRIAIASYDQLMTPRSSENPSLRDSPEASAFDGPKSAGFSAPLSVRPPRTLDEPISHEGYARSSFALVACWHELWTIFQQTAAVPASEKLAFFFQALPWAPLMQRTCDDVYSRIPTGVVELANLACSARVRQVHLVRLYRYLEQRRREEQWKRRQPCFRDPDAPLSSDLPLLEPSPPSVFPSSLSRSLPFLFLSSPSPPDGAHVAAPRDIPVTLSDVSGLVHTSAMWQSAVAGAPTLLSAVGGESSGDWENLLKGLWGARGLFGDGVECIQATQELLDDAAFQWAMAAEPECVWLKHASVASTAPCPASGLFEYSDAHSGSSVSEKFGDKLQSRAGALPERPVTVEKTAPTSSDARESHTIPPCVRGPQEVKFGGCYSPGALSWWGMQQALQWQLAEQLGQQRVAREKHRPGRGLASDEGREVAEWLSLPRSLVALEHLHCRAAAALLQAPQTQILEFVQKRPRDFITLMLVSSFPSPSARIQSATVSFVSPTAPHALLSFLAPASLRGHEFRGTCYVPYRLPASPALFQKLQNLIFRVAPPGEPHQETFGLVAALIILCARWRWVCRWDNTERNGDGSAEQVTRNGDLPVQRFLAYLDTVLDVSYVEALSRTPLTGRESQMRKVLFIQQVFRDLRFRRRDTAMVKAFTAGGGVRTPSDIVCMLAAVSQMPAASGLRYDLLESLAVAVSNAFIRGICSCPPDTVQPPFRPIPLTEFNAAHLASTDPLLKASTVGPRPPGSLHLEGGPAPSSDFFASSSSTSLTLSGESLLSRKSLGSPSSTADFSMTRALRAFPPSPVPLLPYPILAALDTTQLLSQTEIPESSLHRICRLFHVLFEAALRPPGVRAVSPKGLMLQLSADAAAAASPPVESVPDGTQSQHSLETRASASRTDPSALERDNRSTVVSGKHLGHSGEKDTNRDGAPSPGFGAWAAPLAMQASVDDALHLPLILPTLLNIWKQRLAVPRLLPFREALRSPLGKQSGPMDEGPQTEGGSAALERSLKTQHTVQLPASALVYFLCRAAGIGGAAALSGGVPPEGPLSFERNSTADESEEVTRRAREGAARGGGVGISGGQHHEIEARHSTTPAASEKAQDSEAVGQTLGKEDETFSFLEENDSGAVFSSLEFDEHGELLLESVSGGESSAQVESTNGASGSAAVWAAGHPRELLESGQVSPDSRKEPTGEPESSIQMNGDSAVSNTGAQAFAEPLRKLALTTIATAMTVIDEELQWFNEVSRCTEEAKAAGQERSVPTLQTLFQGQACALTLSPFASVASYQDSLSALYNAFDTLFVSNLGTASVFQLQQLALQTRQISAMPAYLPFSLREENLTRVSRQGEAQHELVEANPGKQRGDEVPELMGREAEKVDNQRLLRSIEQNRRRDGAVTERRRFFFGALIQAVLMRLVRVPKPQGHLFFSSTDHTLRNTPDANQGNASRDMNPASEAFLQRPGALVKGGGRGDTNEEAARQAEAMQFQLSNAEQILLLELLLHLLAGAPPKVQSVVLPQLLEQAASPCPEGSEEHDTVEQLFICSPDKPGAERDHGGEPPLTASLQSAFVSLFNAVSTMPISRLLRLFVAAARLDLFSCLCPNGEAGVGALSPEKELDGSAPSDNNQHLGPLPRAMPFLASGLHAYLPNSCPAQPDLVLSRGVRRDGQLDSPGRPQSTHLHLLLLPLGSQLSSYSEGTEMAISNSGDRGSAKTCSGSSRRKLWAHEKRRAASQFQGALENALRQHLGGGVTELSFGEAVGFLWSVAVMPGPPVDLLVLLLDRLESVLGVVLRERRIMTLPADLPEHLPPLTAGPVYRFLDAQSPGDCARLRCAWVSLQTEGAPGVLASLQARFPLTWLAFQILESATKHRERSLFSESSSGVCKPAGESASSSASESRTFASGIIRALTRHGVTPSECAIDFSIPGLPFKFDVAVPQRRLVCIAGPQCARFSNTEEAETSDSMLEVGEIEPDLVVAVPTAPLVVKRRGATGGKASDFEVQEFVVGKAKASTSSEQSSRRDAGSAGGRRLIRRLCTHAGYRVIEIDSCGEIEDILGGAFPGALWSNALRLRQL
ncbi:protein transport protein sec31 [Cystoisospora suis]|uniref:Protein transport protein sec31 n=1 Tax=Cystoisospora suis TaxID=483139 RepID=A0A2C6L3P0_9APIC|nr:protein transport protein sec31 [Cystoisospora suis]